MGRNGFIEWLIRPHEGEGEGKGDDEDNTSHVNQAV